MSYTITTTQAIQMTYVKATGKATPPTAGSSKYNRILALLDFYQHTWASEPGIDWFSLRAQFPLPTLITTTDTYAIPVTVGKVSNQEGDFVRIVSADGQTEYDYTIIDPNRLYDDQRQVNSFAHTQGLAFGTCTVIGNNLVFDHIFKVTEGEFGGTIKLPGYTIPPTIADTTGVIVVDNPMWLVTRTAAAFCQTDITRQGYFPALLQEANEMMDGMKAINGGQVSNVYRGGFSVLGQTWS